jgi:PAS domain S-box-containing protein
VFQGNEVNLATQLWVASRYLESLSLLFAPLFFGRRLKANLLLIFYALVTFLLLGSIFFWPVFPDCFVEPGGLTPFKKISEYIISLILFLSFSFLINKRKEFNQNVLLLLALSILLTIGSELAFTFYTDLYGLSNLTGHFLKILSFYLIYKAVIETGLVKPYNLLFHNLKQKEQAYKKERDKAQQYLDIAKVIITVIDRDGRVSMINKMGCEILGYEEKEMIQANWFDTFVPERDRLEMKAGFEKLMAGHIEPMEYTEKPVLTKSGKERFIAWHNTVLRDDSGEILCTLNSGEDITERKRAENALKRSEERYALAQRAANIGSWDWNIITGGLHWSDQIESMFGFGYGEFGGTYEDFLECVHPDDRQNLIDSVNTCIEEDKDYDIEHRIVWPDGTVRFMSETGDVIRDEEGHAVRMLGVVQDITERKQAEEKISNLARFPSENPNPVLRINHDNQILYKNEAVNVILQQEGLSEKDIFKILPHDIEKLICQTLETGKSLFDLEVKISDRTYSFSLAPVSGSRYVNIYATNISEVFEAFIGLKREEIVGKTVYDIASKELADNYQEKDLALINKPGTQVYFSKVKDNSGENHDVIFHKATFRKHDGQVDGLVGAIHDITERKKIEEALENAYRFLKIQSRHSELSPLLKEFLSEVKSFTGCTATGIRILDDDGNMTYQDYTGFNQACYETESPVSIKTDRCLCVHIVKGETDSLLPHITEGGSFHTHSTTRLYDKAPKKVIGNIRSQCNILGFGSVALIPIRSGNRILGLIHVADDQENRISLETLSVLEKAGLQLGTAVLRIKAEEELRRHQEHLMELVEERTMDLTAANERLVLEIIERKDAEELLSESGKKYRGLSQEFNTLLDAIPDAILLVSPDLKVRWANQGAAALLGKQGSDLTGKHCYHLWDHTLSACNECHALKCFQAGQTMNDQIITPNGRILEANSFPIPGEDGTVGNVIIVYSDITEKITLEAEAMRAAHLASLGELAAGVAHEINNPTNGIINYAQILLDESDNHGTGRDLAERIIVEGDRIARIVKNLLSFARDRKEGKSLVHISEMLDDSLALTKTQIQKEGIQLKVYVSPDLPRIIAHPQQIQQVFLNIINNARYALTRKYPETNENKILEIRSERITIDDCPHVRVTFHDRGTGIPADVRDKVLHPFFSTKPADKGTGLGLSISHGILSDHNSKLIIDSVEGEFTKLIIDIPAEGEGQG